MKISVGENGVLGADRRRRMWNRNANVGRAQVRQRQPFGGFNRASQKDELAGAGQWEEIGNWLA